MDSCTLQGVAHEAPAIGIDEHDKQPSSIVGETRGLGSQYVSMEDDVNWHAWTTKSDFPAAHRCGGEESYPDDGIVAPQGEMDPEKQNDFAAVDALLRSWTTLEI